LEVLEVKVQEVGVMLRELRTGGGGLTWRVTGMYWGEFEAPSPLKVMVAV
jgi:hypothetical protein